MELSKLLVWALALLMITSGCLGKKSTPSSTESSDDHEHDEEGEPQEAEMGPLPTASFVILVDGNATTEDNGSFALTAGANVTFDATNSTGSNVTIGWDFGDGNTTGTIPEMPAEDNATDDNATETETSALALDDLSFFSMEEEEQDQNSTDDNETASAPENATVVHVFEATNGSITVTLYVTDEHNRTATATANITVAAAVSDTPVADWIEKTQIPAKPNDGALHYTGSTACTAPTDVKFTIVEPTNGTIVKKIAASTTVAAGPGLGQTVYYTLKDPAATVIVARTNTAPNYVTLPIVGGEYTLTLEACTAYVNNGLGYNAGTITVTSGAPAAAA